MADPREALGNLVKLTENQVTDIRDVRRSADQIARAVHFLCTVVVLGMILGAAAVFLVCVFWIFGGG